MSSVAKISSHFNPLPSYEGRLGSLACLSRSFYFNPLPSYEGRRAAGEGGQAPAKYFNPLPSYEGRHRVGGELVAASPFQSTPLIRGETAGLFFYPKAQYNFNPLPSYEGRPRGAPISAAA